MNLRWLPEAAIIILLFTTHASFGQQTYVDNRQLACNEDNITTFGYTCNGPPTCQSYLTFRSQSPPYNTPTAIATLLNSNASSITSINNFSSTSATIPANTIVVVPIANCSCTAARYYQHNATYVLQSTNETYFSVANNTYGGLTTCQAMISQNPYNFRQLAVGMSLTVPLRCACPTANQTASGVRSLVTFLITWGNTIQSIAGLLTGVTAQSILDANELSPTRFIFPFTPLLVPLTTTPTRIDNSATPSPPPAPPVIPVTPPNSGGSSGKWVAAGVGIGVSLLLLVLTLIVLVYFFRKRKIQRRRKNQIPAKNFPASNVIPPESNSWSISSEGVRIAIGSLTVYKYEDLRLATGDFSDENNIKGLVYRGVFNGDSAAVKIMKGDVSGEINILKQINHSNIIRLSGFCLHQGNTYLVYEFADNGSLSEWLHITSKNSKFDLVLEWKQRVQIAHDIADG